MFLVFKSQHTYFVFFSPFLQLPSVNSTPLDQLSSGSVVKYRCMVQDVFDPQYFAGRYSVTNNNTGLTRIECGSFRDVPQIGVRQG